jgi:hypothetical protein
MNCSVEADHGKGVITMHVSHMKANIQISLLCTFMTIKTTCHTSVVTNYYDCQT